MILTADMVFSLGTKMATAEVDVPEWGDGAQLRVRGMNAKESMEWIRLAKDEPANELVYALAVGACDEHGKPLFTTADMPRLLEIGHKPLIRIANKVFELSGFGKQDTAEKNSESPIGDSHSD